MKKLLILLVVAIFVSGCIGQAAEDQETCTAESGETMSLDDAKTIAASSECGALKDTYVCNENTGTWWLDLETEKEGCNPACVVNIVTKEAEINWRCTGLKTTGLFSLYMKDTIQDLPGYGKATGLNLVVKEIHVFSDVWTTLTTEDQTFDIIGLGLDEKEVVFGGQIATGEYSKIKVVLGESDIMIYNYDFYVWNRTYTLLPDPAEVEIDASFTVNPDQEASVTLDLDIPNSVIKLPCDIGFCYYLQPPMFSVV